MKIKAAITITRDSSDTIRLQIQDEVSRETFVRMEFSPHDFMMALTGLSSVAAQSAEVAGLDVVGMQKVTERRSIIYAGEPNVSREIMRAWLVENGKEDGWIVNPYLGSQGSVVKVDSKTMLNYTVHRYEEPK